MVRERQNSYKYRPTVLYLGLDLEYTAFVSEATASASASFSNPATIVLASVLTSSVYKVTANQQLLVKLSEHKKNILVKAAETVLLRADTQVAVLVEPDRQRQPVSDKEPLANIKLAVVDEQRPLYTAVNAICMLVTS